LVIVPAQNAKKAPTAFFYFKLGENVQIALFCVCECAIYSESFRNAQTPPNTFVLFFDHWHQLLFNSFSTRGCSEHDFWAFGCHHWLILRDIHLQNFIL